jgi:hypothetical protein
MNMGAARGQVAPSRPDVLGRLTPHACQIRQTSNFWSLFIRYTTGLTPLGGVLLRHSLGPFGEQERRSL